MKNRLIGLLFSTLLATSTLYASSNSSSKCGGDMGKKEMKKSSSTSKCGADMKKKEGSSSSSKCGGDMKKKIILPKKKGSSKCGGDTSEYPKESNCGSGKCGS